MTKEEIKSLVAAKIAGQGTNVDAASVLPSIIEGILDLIPEAPVQADLTVTDPTSPAYVKMPIWSSDWENHFIDDEEFRAAINSGMVRDDVGSIYAYFHLNVDMRDYLEGYSVEEGYTPRAIFINDFIFNSVGEAEAVTAFGVYKDSGGSLYVYKIEL